MMLTPKEGEREEYYDGEVSKSEDGQFQSGAYWPDEGTLDVYASTAAIAKDSTISVTSIDDDIVVATKKAVDCSSNHDAIGLSFSHILAKLEVTAKVTDTDNFYAKIDTIKLVAKAPKKYDITEAENSRWTLGDADTTIVYYEHYEYAPNLITEGNSSAVNNGAEQSVTLDKNYVAPQTGVKVYVHYKLVDKNNTEVVFKDCTKNPAIIEVDNDGDALRFGEGMRTILHLTFAREKISFTVDSVNDYIDNTNYQYKTIQ